VKRNGDADAVGFVLAGGRSIRMGADKALVEFRGQPLVAHALEILREAGLDASIAGARSALEGYAPVVEDAQPDAGPLSGICTAMASTAARWAVVVPVDQPLLPASLVRFLVHKAQMTQKAVTITSVTGFAQTFPAVLDRAVLPWLKSELDAGRRGCYLAYMAAAAGLGQCVDVVDAEKLAQSRQVEHPAGLPPASWFLNIDSIEDLHRAEAQWTGFIA
jgi:molybdopterin-guanine dinucleotide biosynthesis protein A